MLPLIKGVTSYIWGKSLFSCLLRYFQDVQVLWMLPAVPIMVGLQPKSMLLRNWTNCKKNINFFQIQNVFSTLWNSLGNTAFISIMNAAIRPKQQIWKDGYFFWKADCCFLHTKNQQHCQQPLLLATVWWRADAAVILFILTLGSAETNPAIWPYLPLWSNGGDIPFDMPYTLSQSQRGVVVIALTFPSYYTLSIRNLIPQRHFLFLSRCLNSPLVSVSWYLPSAALFQKAFPR